MQQLIAYSQRFPNLIFPIFPERNYYEPDYMSSPDKNEFEKFYEENKDKEFNFKEIEAYCKSDVEILAKGCMIYNKIIQNILRDQQDFSLFEPFRVCLTLPSLVNRIYRRYFMIPNTIATQSQYNYPAERSSKKCQIWLNYLKQTEKYIVEENKLKWQKIKHEEVIDNIKKTVVTSKKLNITRILDGYDDDEKTYMNSMDVFGMVVINVLIQKIITALKD